MNSLGLQGGNVAGSANDTHLSTQPPQQGDNGDTESLVNDMWSRAIQDISSIASETENWKIQALPLARIKKIMKSEEFVMQELEKDRCMREGIETDDKVSVKFMISAEAPLVMSKACEFLIQELSIRAWQHTARNRRRTLQRQDIHAAAGESDVYDFLIDVIPRVATHRMPAPNAVPVDMGQMGQNMVMQNFGLPGGQLSMNMSAAMLQHHSGHLAGAPGQADINALLEQQQHSSMHPEQQLMLGFPNQLSALSAGLGNTNGQQQQNHNGASQLQQQILQQQQALAAARLQQQQADQAPSQWSNI